MLRTQISLDSALYARVRAEARRRKISIAELTRQALALQVPPVQRRSGGWMRHAGALASGDASASQSVNAVVYGRGRP